MIALLKIWNRFCLNNILGSCNPIHKNCLTIVNEKGVNKRSWDMRGVCIEKKNDKMRGKRTQVLLKEHKQSTIMQTKENITIIQPRKFDSKLFQYIILLECNKILRTWSEKWMWEGEGFVISGKRNNGREERDNYSLN